MEDIETKTLNGLVPVYPFGKITIVQGDPGEGKTTFALRLAAILSRGDKLPCTDMECMPIDIIYQDCRGWFGGHNKTTLGRGGGGLQQNQCYR